MKKSLSFLALVAFAYLSTSCAKGKVDPMDMQTGLTFSEFDKTLIKKTKDKKSEKEKKEKGEEPIPAASKLIVNPPPKTTINSKTISFSVTDQVQLKDVLIELGRIAKIDVDLDPEISGGIIINAKNRPLSEVIDRIANLGNLRYTYENGTLHFEKDNPYVKNYSLDYLSEGSNLWSDVQSNVSAILTDSAALSNNNSVNNPSANNTPQANNGNAAANNNNAQTTTPLVAINNPSVRKSSISINKSAGLLYAFATQKQHNEIVKYLSEVQKNSSAQVLIEAKLVEVALKNIYKTGINWNWADVNSKGGLNKIGSNNNYSSTTGNPLDITVGILGATGLNASVSALEQFGTTRTLSSPRIHAINNQKAVLNFTDKFVYFRIESNQATVTPGASAATTTRTITSTKMEENIGVELTIIPSINIRSSEVTLNIKPKITVKSDTVKDPASPTNQAGEVIPELINYVPVIQTREINTVAKIQSGNVIVIGGLMKETSENTDKGVPFLQRIPILGYLFKSVSKDSTVVETVIFIKATIVDSGSSTNKVDRDIQEKFDTNKREFF